MTTKNLTQILIDEKFYYIYAPFQNLTFDNMNIPNENAVYKVSLKTNIKINGMPYNHIVTELNYTTDLDEEIFEYLNLTSINKIHFKELDTTKVDQYIENEENSNPLSITLFQNFNQSKF